MTDKIPTDVSFLIVEDMPDQAQLTKAFVLMEFPKAKIVIATTIAEALTFLEKAKPTAVILDMHLEDAEGSELLKVHKEGRGFPVLVLTGDKSETVLSEMMELGADDFLFKPIDELIFQSKLRSLISGRYMSPLSFLGNHKGLGGINFLSDVKITYIDDSILRFQAKFSLLKECVFSAYVGDALVDVKVISSVSHPDDPNLFNIEVELDNPSAEASQQLRKFIFLKNGAKLTHYA